MIVTYLNHHFGTPLKNLEYLDELPIFQMVDSQLELVEKFPDKCKNLKVYALSKRVFLK